MHCCGLRRTVQCCACSSSALHQLLHCSMALSCGFAALQLTVAGLGEAAELRAWVPTRIASPQAARNVKADGWNGGRHRLSLRHLGLAASQWRAVCAARAAMAKKRSLPAERGFNAVPACWTRALQIVGDSQLGCAIERRGFPFSLFSGALHQNCLPSHHRRLSVRLLITSHPWAAVPARTPMVARMAAGSC
jgi:hypothetical protein